MQVERNRMYRVMAAGAIPEIDLPSTSYRAFQASPTRYRRVASTRPGYVNSARLKARVPRQRGHE